MAPGRLKGCFYLAVLAGLVGNLWAGDLSVPYQTTQTLTFNERNTTITRELLSTSGTVYLKDIESSLPEPNRSIVSILRSYPTDGTHKYWWPRRGEGNYDGVTTDIIVNNQVVLKGEAKGRTFCCGLTLEVFYRYLASNPGLLAKVGQNYDHLKGLWFCREIRSPGPWEAMEAYGIGKRIDNLDEALPGDFVQLWRSNNSGHSVIFINWLWGLKGERIGLQYWSTQTGTQGIGLNSELFGDVPGLGLVSQEHLSLSRPVIIH